MPSYTWHVLEIQKVWEMRGRCSFTPPVTPFTKLWIFGGEEGRDADRKTETEWQTFPPQEETRHFHSKPGNNTFHDHFVLVNMKLRNNYVKEYNKVLLPFLIKDLR